MLVLDGSFLLHRSLHTLEELKDSFGNSTGGAFGVINSIHKALKSRMYREPCICMFDSGIPLFRREIYANYKPHKMPVDVEGQDMTKFYSDINKNPEELDLETASFLKKYGFNRDLLCNKLLPALGIPAIRIANTEADDIIATWCKTVRNEPNTIITSDRDLLQLVDDNTEWYDPIRDHNVTKYDFIKEWELAPNNYQFNFKLYKAINGDASDNVPGIEGIGSTTAKKLARELAEGVSFESIERPPRCNSKGFENFKNSKDQIFTNLKLVDLDYPIDNNLPIYNDIIKGLKQQATVQPDEFLANDILKSYSMITTLGIVPQIIQAQDNLDYFGIVKRYFNG